MGFFNTASVLMKDAMTLKVNWNGSAKRVISTLNGDGNPAVIALDVEEREFAERYKNLRISCFSSMFFMFLAFLTIPFSTSMSGFFSSSAATLLFALFYFRYTYMAWVCRCGWSNPSSLEKPINTKAKDYVSAGLIEPKEFFPMPLSARGASK